MTDTSSELQNRLVAYIEAATDLAEAVRDDLVRNGKISEKTTERLLQFVKTADKLDKFTRIIYKGVRTYN